MSLLELMQKLERSGQMDLTLSGHNVERPPEVLQGTARDTFGLPAVL